MGDRADPAAQQGGHLVHAVEGMRRVMAHVARDAGGHLGGSASGIDWSADPASGKTERGADRKSDRTERGADQASGKTERGAGQGTGKTGAPHRTGPRKPSDQRRE